MTRPRVGLAWRISLLLSLLVAPFSGCRTLSTIPARTHFAASPQEPLPLFKLNNCPAFMSDGGIMLIDTGTSFVFLNEQAARKLKIRIDDNASVHITDAAGHEEIVHHIAHVNHLLFGAATFEDFIAVVLTEQDRMRLPFGSGGLLGLSLFWDCLLTLDFPRSGFSIDQPPPTPPAHSLVVDIRHGLIEVPISLGDQTAMAVLDTGDVGFITIDKSLAAKLPFERPPVATPRRLAASGWHSPQSGRLAVDLIVGKQVFHHPIVEISEKRTAFGTAALAPFIVKMAPRAGWIVLERPGPETAPIESPPLWDYGFQIDGRDGHYSVTYVLDGTPAADSGLRPGDKLSAINGKSIPQQLDFSIFKAGPTSPPLQLTIDRGTPFELLIKPALLVP